jgi:hypothetical protein
MRDAAAVLEVIRDRGRRGLPLERLYRCLFNPDLFLLAYGKIYRNAGAMTPGATGTYMRLWQQACRLEQRGEREAGRALRQQMKTLPSRDPADPGYRRLKYCRYADDWVPGFTGPRREAEEIKDETGRFLREQLRLELSPAKTLITHGRTQAARFLGYETAVMHADDKRDHRGHRSINAGIGLKVPAGVIRAKCAPCLHRGKPVRRDGADRRYRFQCRRPVPV